MAQIVNLDHDIFRAKNINITLNRGSEIILKSLQVIGCNNFGLTITNHNISSSPITNIDILGSEDNAFYYVIQQNIFPGGVSAGQTLHFEFNTTSHYLQVLVNTSILATLDIHMTGTE